MPVIAPKSSPTVFNGGSSSSTEGPRGQRATFLYNTQGRGVPRHDDLLTVRALEQSHTIGLPMDTILTQISTTPWVIRPLESVESPEAKHEDNALQTEMWLDGNFNQNDESFDHFLKQWARDTLSIEAGVVELIPEQNEPYLSEMYVRDGSTFVKNPDKHDRLPGADDDEPAYYQFSLAGFQQVNDPQSTTWRDIAAESGSLGYTARAHDPVGFERDRIVWMENSPRSWSPYGFGKVQQCRRAVEILLNQDVSNREHFNTNEIPEGVLAIADANQGEIERVREYWKDEIAGSDHKLPIIGGDTEYKPFRASPTELNFLESQKWYHKLVWMIFGLSQSEVGHIEDVNRAAHAEANIAVWRRTTKPLLELIEQHINNEILPYLPWYHDADGEIEFAFEYDNPEVEERQKEQQRKELDAGTTTINEVRRERGEDPLPWGDLPSDVVKSLARNNPAWFYEWVQQEDGDDDFEPPEDGIGGGGGGGLLNWSPSSSHSVGELEGDSAGASSEKTAATDGGASAAHAGACDVTHGVEHYHPMLDGDGDSGQQRGEKDPLRNDRSGDYPPLKSHADELEKKVAARFEDQRDDLEDELTDAWPDERQESSAVEGETKGWAIDVDSIVDSMNLSNVLAGLVAEANVDAMDKTAEFEAAELERALEDTLDDEDADVAIDFDVEDTFAAERMRRNAAEKMVTVEATVKERIRRTLVDVADDGGNVNDATRALREKFDELSDSHARLVARTETLSASRSGSQALAESSDVVAGKEWRSTSDNRTRDWHAEMDGEKVPEDEDFVVPDVGHEDQPSDYPRTAYTVGEDQPFNCRCVQKAVLADDMPGEARELAAHDSVTVKVGGEKVEPLTERMIEIKDGFAKDGEHFPELLDRLLGEKSITATKDYLGISKNTLYKWGDRFDPELENYRAA